MRFLTAVLCGVLGVAAMIMAAPVVASADAGREPATAAAMTDAGAPAEAQAGTPVEAREYERREAQSPEVQEFAGGDVTIGISVLAVVLIVLLVILLSD